MGFRVFWTLCFFLVIGLTSQGAGPAWAQDGGGEIAYPIGPREPTLHIWNGAALGANQLVLGEQLRVYRKMPWGQGKNLLTSDSHWRLGVMGTAAPTFFRPALLIGVSPLLILDLDLHYGPVFDFFHYRFESFDEPYAWSDRAEMQSSFSVAHQATLNIQFKAAVGPVAVLEMIDVEYFRSKDYYFNWELGTILKNGFYTRSKTFVLYELRPGWRCFVNYERFRYYANTWRSQLVSAGLYLSGVLPRRTTLMVQAGYHQENPDFAGFKIWAAAYWDWDLPLRRK